MVERLEQNLGVQAGTARIRLFAAIMTIAITLWLVTLVRQSWTLIVVVPALLAAVFWLRSYGRSRHSDKPMVLELRDDELRHLGATVATSITWKNLRPVELDEELGSISLRSTGDGPVIVIRERYGEFGLEALAEHLEANRTKRTGMNKRA